MNSKVMNSKIATLAMRGRGIQGEHSDDGAARPPPDAAPILDGIEPIGVRSDHYRRLEELWRWLSAALRAFAHRPGVTQAKNHAVGAYRFLAIQTGGAGLVALAGAPLAQRVAHSYESECRTGLRVLLGAFVILGGWASLAPLSGAVIAAGAVIVETNVKKVQHQAGGIVSKILVHDGVRVAAGDPLVRLDETQTRANLQVVTRQLDEVRVRIARLTAERDGASEPVMPHKLATPSTDAETEQLIASERSAFKARLLSRQSQKDVLRAQTGQLREKIAGMSAQIKAKTMQGELVARELKGVQSLHEKKLVPLPRLTALQREEARLDGERAELTSSIAEAQSKIGEAELQIARVDQDFRTEVLKELRESLDKEGELSERGIAARDQLERLDIRAPASGVVHQLALHTVGGVVAPGEVLMEVVPDTDELQIEARLQPQQIDQVRIGQKCRVRFTAFNQRTTPQFEGVLTFVSADVTHDKQTNASFYTARVTLPDQRQNWAALRLVSGMPSEVYIETPPRTMMSYLLKPIADQLDRTFSEP